MRIQLSEHFTYRKILRFVLPSIIMMIFTSVYSVVDGLFISNFVGKIPFASINLIMPFLMGMGAVGFMIGTGGSALVAKTLGEGDRKRANRYFSMLVYVTVISGVILTVIGLIFIRSIAIAMGATENLLEDCVIYGRIMLMFQTAFMLQSFFQSMFVAAEKPKLGLVMTVMAGLTNMVLDALFVAVLHKGVAGAALATVISQIVGGVFPIFYFARPNSSLLHLTKTTIDIKAIIRVCANGSSELMTTISSSVVGVLYNIQLMNIAGENGVAAYGVIMYVTFIFVALFIGYSIGCAPVIGYNYGSGNHYELKNMFKKSIVIIGALGISLSLLAEILAVPLSKIFVGYDKELFTMTCYGFRLYSLSFLISGFNIFGSAFFTALNNGAVSAGISFMRTLVFQAVSVLIIPILFGITGIWISITAAECFALIVTFSCLIYNRKKYHYI